LYKKNDLYFVDASNGKDAKTTYKAKHLRPLLFVDLNTDLAEIKEDLADGGTSFARN
jgi:thiosulfate/3-mercaptopyruvate sulfurtransferase